MINTQKLKARIVELGLTQSDVANILNLSQVAINQKINNKRAMTVDEAIKISTYLEIQPNNFNDYFFT